MVLTWPVGLGLPHNCLGLPLDGRICVNIAIGAHGAQKLRQPPECSIVTVGFSRLRVSGGRSLHESWRSEIAHIPGLPVDGGASR